MYVLMWTVVLPPENNPVLDDHLLGAVTHGDSEEGQAFWIMS